MPLIDLIAGARPNFVKIAPLIEAFREHQSRGGSLRYRLVHTGQHYDRNMSGSFFEDLGIPEPDVNLECGSGTQAGQTGTIMVRYEELVQRQPCDLTLVVGDVNSTMACAIVAKKLGIPVAHVEAGIRSGDWSMPEEINRVVTDAITDWFFTTSESAGRNLLSQGVSRERIHFVGNTMIDSLCRHRPRFRRPEFWARLELQPGEYLVLTLHRPANVDGRDKLDAYLSVIEQCAGGRKVVFPVHPRTRKNLEGAAARWPRLTMVDPLGYLEFNFLVEHAKAVITDSGGITEETTVLGIPCLSLRDNTERPETVEVGTNVLVGTNPERLRQELARVVRGEWKKGSIPALWDGQTSGRIVEALAGFSYPSAIRSKAS